MPIEVPLTVPGDHVVAAVSERDFQVTQRWEATPTKPKWPIRGKLETIEAPSRHRSTPRCSKYFGACGGCRTQHVTYQEQLRDKQQRVEALFAPWETEIRAIKGADTNDQEPYHYRNKMEFTCSTGRWLLDADRAQTKDGQAEDGQTDEDASQFPFTVGFFPLAMSNARRVRKRSKASRRRWSPRILSIDSCALQLDECNAVLQEVVAECQANGVEAFDFRSNAGFLKNIVLRRGTNQDGQTELMLGLVTTSLDGEQSQLLADIATDIGSRMDSVVSVVQRVDAQSAREHRANGVDDETPTERVLFGRSYLEDSVLDHTFRVSFDSFFQPNSSQASVLYREVQRELATLETPPVVWDLFCGVGSIGICMGPFARKVVGVEIVAAAVDKARENARLNGYGEEQMEFHCADLTQAWPEAALANIARPDVVIVDPPRAGLHKKLIKLLRRLAPARICYISCNPDTQASDFELLSRDDLDGAAYRARYVQPVDMLPHTPHIETVAWLDRQ